MIQIDLSIRAIIITISIFIIAICLAVYGYLQNPIWIITVIIIGFIFTGVCLVFWIWFLVDYMKVTSEPILAKENKDLKDKISEYEIELHKLKLLENELP